MIYDCCVRQKKCRSILKHVLKRCDNRKSCRRPVVSLSHATKSYRVNRPLGGFSSDKTGISYNINLLTAATKIFQIEIRPTKPRFHVLAPRSFRVSAIFE